MDLVDRIEKRRFVGRELLLWLWFESELFEGTLSTKKHGSFGLWIERQIVLTAGKESTRIKGAQPAASREAKESLLRGKLPDSAGFHLVLGEEESNFTLKAEQLAIAGLSLPTVLGAADEEPPPKDSLVAAPPRRRKRPREDRARAEIRESDEEHEAFYERMHLTRGFEGLFEALYRDFLALRLGRAWGGVVATMRRWAVGEEVDEDRYRTMRDGAIADATTPKRRVKAAAGITRRAQRRR
jgi:hypothetical protein